MVSNLSSVSVLLGLCILIISSLPGLTYALECPEIVPFFDLRLPFQYARQIREENVSTHLLSVSPILGLNATGAWAGSSSLGAMVLTRPNPDCSLGKCLFMLQPLMRRNGQNVSIIYARSFELFRFPGFVTVGGVQPMFCAINFGLCGAYVPLYSFTSSTFSDHILSIGNSMSNRNYRIDSGGTPICYIWPLPKHNFMADLATTETIGKDGMEEAEICCDDQTADGTKMETVTANAGGKGQEERGRVEGEEEEEGKKPNTKDEEEENIPPMGMTKVPEKTMRMPNTGSTTDPGSLFSDPATDNSDHPPISLYFLAHWHWWILVGACSALLFCACITLACCCC